MQPVAPPRLTSSEYGRDRHQAKQAIERIIAQAAVEIDHFKYMVSQHVGDPATSWSWHALAAYETYSRKLSEHVLPAIKKVRDAWDDAEAKARHLRHTALTDAALHPRRRSTVTIEFGLDPQTAAVVGGRKRSRAESSRMTHAAP